ncbi:PAS domain-containing protein [Emcibacter sp.]|uniref:PAS domain-containing protein n=1 Tax=Emcibacter sp. TaxID=1979954 RepID=UPI002AA8968C|nr:PAS domain-containing protein [Emcibacter sp.]
MNRGQLVFPPEDKEKQVHTILEEAPLTDASLIQSSRLKEVLDIWQQTAGATGIPPWSSFNPMDFTDLLPAMSVYSNEGSLEAPDYLLRLEGDLSSKFFNVPTSMTRIQDIHSHSQKDYLINHLTTALRQRKPNYIVRNLGWNKGRDYIEYEILSLPFTSREDGTADRVLCAKVFQNKYSSPDS